VASTFPMGTDIAMTDDVLKTVRRDYMKVRKTFRTLLGHVKDFDVDRDSIPIHQLLPGDQFALQTLFSVSAKIMKCYGSFDFPTAIKIFIQYFKVELRCGYLEYGKNRLYFEKRDFIERKSAQTCIYWILNTTTRLIAPILSFLSDEVFDEFKKKKSFSIHLEFFCNPPNVWEEICKDKSFASMKHKQFSLLEKIKALACKDIAKKYLGHLGNCLGAHLMISLNIETSQLLDSLKPLEVFLEEYLSVSKVTVLIEPNIKEPIVIAIKPQGDECGRCWRFNNLMLNGLCQRCDLFVNQIE